MTAFGFQSINNNGQVLISSKTKNLHFLGKAAYYATLFSSNGYGGIRRWTFRIASSATPVPFFSMPTSDRYAIVRMTLVSANLWEIEIIRSGTSDTLPEIYVFTEVVSQMKPLGSWGMQILHETSGITFDSRLKPLIVKGGTSVIPPFDPMNSLPSGLAPRTCSADTSNSFVPNKVNNTIVTDTNLTKPIYSYQSISQTMREVVTHDEWEECKGQRSPFSSACWGSQHFWIWNSHYWAFWRAGISGTQSGAHTSINCGWITVNYNCWQDNYEDGNFFGLYSEADSRNIAGKWPFSNQTINYREVPIILADAKYYD